MIILKISCVFVVYLLSCWTDAFIPMKINIPGMVFQINITITNVSTETAVWASSTKIPENSDLNYRIKQDDEEISKPSEHFVQKIHEWKNVGLYSMDKSYFIDYFHASSWGNKYPSCNGHRQSPIDINPHIVQRLDEKIWKHMEETPKEMMIINNGNTVQLIGNWVNSPFLLGPGILPYKGKYAFSDVTFHWSRKGNGSEHVIKGNRFVLEMQFVFYKELNNSDVMDAANKDDHIAIMSVLYQISNIDNPALSNMIRGIKEVKETRTINKIATFPLSSLLPNENTYYEYSGSITLPPCVETVTWLIMDHPQYISDSQMQYFRQIVGNNNATIITNSRILNRAMYG